MKSLAVAVFALSQSAIGADLPTGGGQMQQIPPMPTPERTIPEIRIEKNVPSPVAPANETPVRVNVLRLTGQTLYSEAELVAVAGFRPGADYTLAELRAMAARIADHYHRVGYFVAQAYLPAQNVREGVVTIAIVEGHYGKILLRNKSNLSDGLANGLLGGLNEGDPIAIGPLENRLLLLSDVPGVNVQSTLVPGASVGASDLVVDVTPGQRLSGSVEADNAGNRYTGEYRVGATVNLNNLAGRGDVASLRVLTSGSGLTYGRASYQMMFGKATAGVAYTNLDYRLGREFESLRAHGDAQIVSVYASYPLIRSRATNLYALVDFDAKTFQDRVDSTGSVTDKKARVFMGSLHGNHRDNIGRGGLNTFSVTLSSGDIDIITPGALAADAAAARTNGRFEKIGFSAARLQGLTDRFSLYGSIYGQFASKNLDISEKMSLGGPYAVRGYPVGEAYADEGYVVNLEARYLLPQASPLQKGQVHLIAFVDDGAVRTNRNPWTNGPNTRHLSAAGVGVTWTAYNDFAVKAYYAQRLGGEPATSAPDSKGRFWLQAIKYF